jgi:hypothetical protein
MVHGILTLCLLSEPTAKENTVLAFILSSFVSMRDFVSLKIPTLKLQTPLRESSKKSVSSYKTFLLER